MIRELVIRHVPHYGFLPIVREFDTAIGEVGREIYRGEFKASVILAAYAAERHMEGGEPCN